MDGNEAKRKSLERETFSKSVEISVETFQVLEEIFHEAGVDWFITQGSMQKNICAQKKDVGIVEDFCLKRTIIKLN